MSDPYNCAGLDDDNDSTVLVAGGMEEHYDNYGHYGSDRGWDDMWKRDMYRGGDHDRRARDHHHYNGQNLAYHSIRLYT